MTAALKGSGKYVAKLAAILLAITLVVALLLGLVNYITADRIAAINEQKTAAAMSEVLPAESYDEIDFTDETGLVKAAYRAGDVGYVIEVTPTGFGGTIDMVVGISTDGAVTGVSIINMVETSGLGQNASKESFRAQYTGGTGPFAVNKDGGTIDALTGATITSRAVTRGVNAALSCAANLG